MTDTALTVDQAVAEMTAPVEAPVAANIPAEEKEQPAEAASEDAPEPETAEEEAPEGEEPDAEEEPEEEDEEKAEAIPAPKNWDAEDKEWFATLNPEAQARVLKNEEKREAVLAKDREKARAEARMEVEGEVERVAKVANAFKEYIPRVIATHNAYWGENGFDLHANVEAYGADEALKMQARYNAEQAQIESAVEAMKMAENQARFNYQRAQHERLTKLRPELTDPKEGKAKREAFAKALLDLGATGDELEMIPAWGVDLALDGLKYRKAQAEAKAKAKAPPKPVAATVRPSVTPTQSSPEKTITQLKQRLAKTGALEDAVALQLAEEQARRRA